MLGFLLGAKSHSESPAHISDVEGRAGTRSPANQQEQEQQEQQQQQKQQQQQQQLLHPQQQK